MQQTSYIYGNHFMYHLIYNDNKAYT